MKVTLTKTSETPEVYDTGVQNDEQRLRQTTADFDYFIGLGCLVLNAAALLLSQKGVFFNDVLPGSFILPFAVSVIYLVMLLATGKARFIWKKQPAAYLPHRILLGYVWLVSCFTFNLSFPVFNASADWLSVLIVIFAFSGVCFAWEKALPAFLKSALFFLLAASTVLWCYYAIYLSRLYLASLIFLVFLGLSAHTFIPLLLAISHIRALRAAWSSYRLSVLTGLIVPLLLASGYSIRWNVLNEKIRNQIVESSMREASDLPKWVSLGQVIETDWTSKQIVMGGLVYQMPGELFSVAPSTLNMEKLSEHNPLVLIASLFSTKPDLTQKERISLLDVLFGTRHFTQERLWSGSDLVTANVLTNARVYPEFRLAYTEKTINIQSNASSKFQQEEALFTFHLPEGSVVSSLSLWINGVEQKSYLTTQTKADLAYNNIVGIETRDPSVVHWQEGNAVKLKVFPCTSVENRRFKIGITSPLKSAGRELIYENIWFEGPAAERAFEHLSLNFTNEPGDIHLPFKTQLKDSRTVVFSGKYQPAWEARFPAPPLSDAVFQFNGKSYKAMPIQAAAETFAPAAIYLDINKAWSRADFDEVGEMANGKPVFVFDNKLEQLTADNQNAIFEKLSTFNYSLFPIHLIANREKALLITKSNGTSPNLKDLAGSGFSKAIARDTQPVRLRTFDFGEELSPYLKTMQELRLIRNERTGLAEIEKLLASQQFPADLEVDQSALKIGSSEMIIVESNEPVQGSAPDHLLRLFAYNQIMKKIGRAYLDRQYQQDSVLVSALVNEADQAHIVTPVSSLIVLESQKDYDNFDIRKSKKSLDNATLKSSGAVPEPHEWVLIILFALLVTYYTFRNYARW
ncbi:XrtN system VIT domain-containing protein [Dyadobacter crusticola]|uniref:XrtN system VIT domain-containing protein n=1 Tax=Dyadobacter crusticola TaxID=292407 RepID=UPI0004E0CC64|nr:XrtN system VIT domain-containing protein [Dyadobacter crusticola]